MLGKIKNIDPFYFIEDEAPLKAKHHWELLGKRTRNTYPNGTYNGITSIKVWVTIWNEDKWYKVNKWRICLHFPFKFWRKE